MRRSPPVDSATRRTMSRPRPVEPTDPPSPPLPLPPRARAARGSAIPGPASETRTMTASPLWWTSTAKAVPTGVWRKTLPSNASSAAASSGRATGMRAARSAPATRVSRPSSSASADQKLIRSRITSEASHPASAGDPWACGRCSRAARMMASTSCSNCWTAARVCSAAGPSPREAAFSRSTVSGVRSRCERSAANSRSLARSWTTWSAIELNATAAERSSVGPSSGTRVASLPSPSSWAAPARRWAGRTIRTPSRSATATEPTTRARPTPASISQAVATPLETSSSGT